jgi:L-amino acid N-acyltransferase YncA
MTHPMPTVKLTLDPVIFERESHMVWWYEIRNEDSVRAASRSRKKIKVEEHKLWWQESAKLKTRKLYFLRRHDGVHQPIVVGFARLDHRGTWTEVSIAVSQDWRGQGIAKTALRSLGIEVAQLRWPVLGAVINAQNHASIALFLGSGYLLKKKGFVQVTLPKPKRII